MSNAPLPNTFGEYLRFLRKRARLTQKDLGIAVGYSTGQICMLENGQRLPELSSLAALFVPALYLEKEARLSAHLFELGRQAREAAPTAAHEAESELIAQTQPATRAIPPSPHPDPANLPAQCEALNPSAQAVMGVLMTLRQPVNLLEARFTRALSSIWPNYQHSQAIAQLTQHGWLNDLSSASLAPPLQDGLQRWLALRPDIAQQAHRAAAQWLEMRGEWVAAAQDHCAAGDLQLACDAVLNVEVTGLDFASEHNPAQNLLAVLDDILNAAQHQLRAERFRPQQHMDDLRQILRQMLVLRADCLLNTVRVDEAHANYREALALATQPVMRAQIADKLAGALLQRGKQAEALALCEQASAQLTPPATVSPAVAQFAALDEGATRAFMQAQLDATRCKALLMLTRYDEAEQACARALSAAEQYALIAPRAVDGIRANAHSTLGTICRIQRRLSDARYHLQEAADYARFAGLRQIEARCLTNLGNLLFEQGDLEQASDYQHRALTAAGMAGDQFVEGRILNTLAAITLMQAEPLAALNFAERAIGLKKQMGDRQGVASSENQRAFILLHLKRFDEARRLGERILTDTERSGEAWLRGQYLNMLGLIVAMQGDGPRAIALLNEALATEGAQRDQRLRSSMHTYLGMAHFVAGDLAQASAIAEVAPAPEFGGEVLLDHALLRLALLLWQGQSAAAAEVATQAYALAQRNGYRLYLNAIHRLMTAPALPPTRHGVLQLWLGA